ncbi:hypothetical protein E1B28_008436 [Marasmius oreades]|uniref:Uncharacterized protein n=1 Tax=Marasmius oreades TaxID=181124 RepID=A0A9P7RYJ1_9AGAR|nr:uncharacterized protein E1B28_008436 [Marasmius oreades]KAG7092055.1 hypothetical protein E1B28_008436 [Marasmius oreades]
MEVPPPSYQAISIDYSAPPYSDSPRSTDIILPDDPHTFFDPSRFTNFNWKYKSSHMSIDFGPRIWGLGHPAYGLGGTIQFSVRTNGVDPKAEDVSAVLEGTLFSSITRKSILFMSAAIPSTSSAPQRGNQKDVRGFTIKIPSTVGGGLTSSCPPSFTMYDLSGMVYEITYRVKIRLTGLQGLRVWGDETKVVHILYLPKSRPSIPPLTSIRRPLQARDGSIFCPEFDSSDSTRTFALSPRFPRPRSTGAETEFHSSIFVTLPRSLCFTSGLQIPYLFSFVFPSHPHLSTLYAKSFIQVTIVKQLLLWSPKHRRTKVVSPSPFRVEWRLATSRPRLHSEYREGVYMLRGSVGTGTAGSQCSWKLDNYAGVQYVLKLSITPALPFVDNLPSFSHEEVVELTTDNWGSLHRELTSMGGLPTPALGLAKAQSPTT